MFVPEAARHLGSVGAPEPSGSGQESREDELVELPLERIEAEISELAAHIYAATCRWLILVSEFDRREGYVSWGSHSCARWLAWRCSIAPRAAREHVRVARSLRELTLVRAAFGRGELSYSKVHALTRVATPENQEYLLMIARHGTAAQLERLVRAYRGAVSCEEANEAHERRHLSWNWEDDGSLSFRGRLSPDEGAVLLRALEAGRNALKEPATRSGSADVEGGSAEPPPRPSNADALVGMAESLLSEHRGELSGGDLYQVMVHVDPASLAGEDGHSQLEDGPRIAAETARRLSCDASVVSLRELDGGAASVARKTRTIPPALRRALRARDGGCRFPGCPNHRFVDAHHIHHWARGGETSLDNLVQLCRRHHRLLHEGGFMVEWRVGGRLLFRRPDGRSLPAVPALPRGRSAEIIAGNRRLRLQIRHETCVPLSAGDRMDLDLAVMGLMARAWPPDDP
jgi:hypothetical protein